MFLKGKKKRKKGKSRRPTDRAGKKEGQKPQKKEVADGKA